MISAKIAIIGGGLSGLYAAYLLEQAGITDYVLLEARDRLGGRILSNHGFDLGATWIWPEINPALMQVINTLQLPYFEQHESGDILIEKSRNTPPQRMPKSFWSSPSIRLQGGMDSLIQALKKHIPAHKIITDQQVLGFTRQDSGLVDIKTKNRAGELSNHEAQQILLALPPRLFTKQMQISPKLPSNLILQWLNTATWMAPHAKYVAVYSEAFWQQQGLSGQASSHVGPMGEIHDASMPDGNAGLFGFIGIPYSVRQQLTEDELLSHCRAQLVRLYGASAATPIFEALKDWSADDFTATATDWMSQDAAHGLAPQNTAMDSVWQNQLIGIGSEWSQEFSGYLAGCIDAATVGVQQAIDHLGKL